LRLGHEFSKHFQRNEYVPCYKRAPARKREAIGALAAGLLSCESSAFIEVRSRIARYGDAFRRGLR
jgi:hypothetical protein